MSGLNTTRCRIEPHQTVQICSAMFISSAISNIKVGDLTGCTALTLGNDAPGEEVNMGADETTMPDGSEGPNPKLNCNEERAFLRDSTASFPGSISHIERNHTADSGC